MLFSSFSSNHTHDVIVPPDEHHMYSHQPVNAQTSAPDPIKPDNASDQLSVEEHFINIINQLTGE